MAVYRALFALCLLVASGCAVLPDVTHQTLFHNPFPQLHRVAVLPFYNQSDNPHLNGEQVALAYYNELQLVPGFDVMPPGVVKQVLLATRTEPRSAPEFQALARALGVDAVIAGSVTDFTPYYPPRLTLDVSWFAANPGFHEIPAGYGLPWGTEEEEYIPKSLVYEAEFALARAQLATQSPSPEKSRHPGDEIPLPSAGKGAGDAGRGEHSLQSHTADDNAGGEFAGPNSSGLPPDWPDPRGFVPNSPSAKRPPLVRHHGPVLTQVRTYNGHDAEFTQRLQNYCYFRDDARFGGWQTYLQRSDDFIRFCCYLHITEMLAARGGAGESRVVWRWPIGRYER